MKEKKERPIKEKKPQRSEEKHKAKYVFIQQLKSSESFMNVH